MKRILIIEPVRDIGDVLGIFFMEMGECAVRVVTTAKEGLEALKQARPDIIMVDEETTDWTDAGRMILRACERLWRDDMPKIVLTTNRKDIISTDFDDILTKPYQLEDILRLVRL